MFFFWLFLYMLVGFLIYHHICPYMVGFNEWYDKDNYKAFSALWPLTLTFMLLLFIVYFVFEYLPKLINTKFNIKFKSFDERVNELREKEKKEKENDNHL